MADRRNPLATPAQKAIEDKALALLHHPEVIRAREVCTVLWKNATGWTSRDQADRFDNMIDEYMFHHAMRAANWDANYPEAVRFMAPKHHWFGRDVPGSRWGGDSPDFIYRTIPIAHGGSYEIHGRQTCVERPTVNYSLMSDNTAAPVTQTILDSLDMDVATDGSFTISVDDTPADGRKNHIQTRPGADFIMVRDALGDWIGQSANALTVKRLNPDGDPKGIDELAGRCARTAVDLVYYSYYVTQTGNSKPTNEIRPPVSAGVFGGMPSQWGTKANLALDEDDAILIRCNAAGAMFRNFVLTDAFHLSIDYWARTSSLNMAQMTPDEDGDFTLVISHQDPGLHNWIDMGHIRRSMFVHRWQAFRRDTRNEPPWMTGKMMKFDKVAKELPDGVRPIDEDGRKAQLAARAEGVRLRFVDS
ncbi:MAG: hypothetical protein AB7F98_01810 [Novosphingobium sp.]